MKLLTNRITIEQISIFFLAIFCWLISTTTLAQKADIVKTYQDENGWKLKVNGRDFYVKGVVWGYSPKNENYTYNLWGQGDEFVKKVIDYEFSLMRKAGVNAIRSFATIPPKWVTYIHQKYNIMTAINPLMGRYGVTVNGVWEPNTNYADPTTRKVLKDEVLATVNKYKNVPGVLMFALGNESNYGLSWASFEIENLPVGEQNKEKAKYLYSLFAEVIEAGKAIDPNHPFTIVNGDIQYIDLIAKYGKNWDLLGINVYRGVGFTGLWQDVKAKLGLPVLFFEFGSDAFNARDFTEDQIAQAHYLKSQWLEMYKKSYGQGQEGNSLGGFVFEWRDEWWKYKQTENLDKHDRTASWENGGYKFDHVPGQNNMNEEWWGITRLGDINDDGIYTAEPRMAYDVLTAVWRIDPYGSKNTQTSISKAFNNIDMDKHELRSEIRHLKALTKRSNAFKVSGARLRIESLSKWRENDVDLEGRDGVEYEQALMGFVDFEFQPNKKLKGDFTLNFIADAAESDFEFRYGDRILNRGPDTNVQDADENDDRFELYDFQASYQDKNFDLLGFYHVPRYHWGYEGDFFGLLRETTDIEGQDIWNSKAPYGVELIGKGTLDGLKIVTGPEVYWGANPKIILKYQFGNNKQYTFMHSEDFSRRDDTSGGAEATSRRSNQTTISGKFKLKSGVDLEIGAISGNGNKVGEEYDRIEGTNVVRDKIEIADTLGAKAKISFNMAKNTRAYVGLNYAGLVADGGEPLKERGTQLPYSELGNKKVVELGADTIFGHYTLSPKFLYRANLVDANPSISPTIGGSVLNPGIRIRNLDDDPFAVLNNREVRAFELYLTYDPTPETDFYVWDNDVRENAAFAYNVGITLVDYRKPADPELVFLAEFDTNAAFSPGLPAEELYLFKSRLVFNPNKALKSLLNKVIINLEAAKQQSTALAVDATKYQSIESKIVLNRQNIISGKIVKDGWGPYDFQRQFNLTFPKQYEIKYVRLLENGKSEKDSSKFTLKLLHRTLDEDSPDEFYEGGLNDSMSEIQAYLEYNF